MPASHIEIWAALALAPLIFYASALSRGKAAPKLRGPYPPYILLLLCLIPVYFTGGLNSPLFGLYGLLTLVLGALAGIRPALAVAGIVTVLELLLSKRAGLEVSPVPLMLPWSGLILGWFLSFLTPSPSSDSQKKSNQPLSAPIPESAPADALPMVDPRELTDKNAQSLLDLAYHAHPHWNSLLLFWIDKDKLKLRQGRTRQGELTSDLELEAGEGLLGWSLREKKRLNVPELAASTASALPYYLGEVKAKAVMATPFFDEGELLGMLVVDRCEAGEWSADEMAAAEFLGRQIVQQSQQAQFLGRVQARGHQVSELHEISKQLSDDLDRDTLIKRIPSLLGRLLSFDSFYLAMREGEAKDFSLVASLGYDPDYQRSYTLEEGTVLGGWVLTSGEPVTYNASHAQASVPPFLSDGLIQEAGSFLLVPVMRNGRISGLLKLDRRLDVRAFSEQDKEVTLIFAALAAVTLDNARLYTQHKTMATTDGLTGLYNHRYFQERLALEIDTAKRLGKPLSLALTDIDFFKKFNDSFGHQEGDNVLRRASTLIREMVRPGKDIVCRYGGEEFVVIMPDCDLVEAREVVERVRTACAETLIGGQGPEARAITLSIGLCSYPLGAQEQRDIIHKADEALYKAKQTGRNRTCSFKDLP